MMHDMTDKMVVVRSSPSGVWFGVLQAWEGATIRLGRARRVWEWSGAGSCSGLAAAGPEGGKIALEVEQAVIFEVCEVLLATPQAVARLNAITPWNG